MDFPLSAVLLWGWPQAGINITLVSEKIPPNSWDLRHMKPALVGTDSQVGTDRFWYFPSSHWSLSYKRFSARTQEKEPQADINITLMPQTKSMMGRFCCLFSSHMMPSVWDPVPKLCKRVKVCTCSTTRHTRSAKSWGVSCQSSRASHQAQERSWAWCREQKATKGCGIYWSYVWGTSLTTGALVTDEKFCWSRTDGLGCFVVVVTFCSCMCLHVYLSTCVPIATWCSYCYMCECRCTSTCVHMYLKPEINLRDHSSRSQLPCFLRPGLSLAWLN